MNNYFFYFSLFVIFLILPIYTLYVIKKNNNKPSSLKKQILRHIFTINIVIALITLVYIVYFLKIGFLLIHNNNIENVLQNSHSISEAYNEENKEKIKNDILIIARTINSQSFDYMRNKDSIKVLIESYASLKELSEIVIFVPSKNLILAKNDFSFSLIFDNIPGNYLLEATREKPAIIENLNYSKMRAVIELEGFPYKTYLMISRHLDEKITKYLLESKDAMNSYEKIKKNITKMQNIFLSVFFITILASIFIIKFLTKIISKQLIEPINDFVNLAQKEDLENIDFKFIENKQTNILELNVLINSFHSIIKKLNQSKEEIDNHNNFINAIFSQTPYGLFVINLDGEIIMQNIATKSLLHQNESGTIKQLFFDKLKIIIQEIDSLKKDFAEENINIINTSNNKHYNFLVKITQANLAFLDETSKNNKYFLIIFNDITEHLAYQRDMLWIDVAKRITHEIRNPLTPILLSVERIEYKYLEKISENDKPNFIKYLDNIKRHTNTISTIIDGFIEFGKMPEPEFHEMNLNKIISETIDGAYFDKSMKYELSLYEKEDEMNFFCDEKQIMRMLINIFKNSYESFCSKKENSEEKLIIKIKTFKNQKAIHLIIEDNGPGFPLNLIENVSEPYVTTKEKGSGLGLSIVKRIVSDHGGEIFFENKKSEAGSRLKGASVKICFD